MSMMMSCFEVKNLPILKGFSCHVTGFLCLKNPEGFCVGMMMRVVNDTFPIPLGLCDHSLVKSQL